MSSRDALRYEPRVLLSGLAYVESPRWQDDRLWFAHWGAEEIVAESFAGRLTAVDIAADGAADDRA